MSWAEINKKRLPFIRTGERVFAQMYRDIRNALAKKLQNLTQPEQVIQQARNFRMQEEGLKKYYEIFYFKTSIAFARDFQAKCGLPLLERKQEDIWEPKIKEYIRLNAGKKITQLLRTAYEDIENITKKAVTKGIEEGWGMDKIAKEIINDLKDLDMWKARRIARTEVVAASNYGIKLGAEDLPGRKVKVWVSSFDTRSREDHMAADGQRVAFEEMFEVGGEKLEYPGDPRGSAGNIINCRCGYEVILEGILT